MHFSSTIRAYLLHISSASLCTLRTENQNDCAYRMHSITLIAHISMQNGKMSLCISHLVCRRGLLNPFTGYLPTRWGIFESRGTPVTGYLQKLRDIFFQSIFDPITGYLPHRGESCNQRQSHHRIQYLPNLREILHPVFEPFASHLPSPSGNFP